MLDVKPETGAITIYYPGVPIDELPATCALELIDRAPDGMTLEEIGAAFNLTRERVRQIARDAQAKIEVKSLTRQLAEDE
jgi:DNA-directed RNA polymerase specialized sigma24 family protein